MPYRNMNWCNYILQTLIDDKEFTKIDITEPVGRELKLAIKLLSEEIKYGTDNIVDNRQAQSDDLHLSIPIDRDTATVKEIYRLYNKKYNLNKIFLKAQ